MKLFDPYGEKSEAEIQSEFFDRVRAKGWTADKYENKSRKGCPDTLCYKTIRRRLISVWIEFKRLGESPEPIQLKRHDDMRRAGWDVVWFDNVEEAVAYLNQHDAI